MHSLYCMRILIILTQVNIPVSYTHLNGQITFDYTNGGALGSFDELLEGTDSGVYDMSLITLSYYETYVPEAEILSFPYLMMDYDDAHDVLDGEIGDWLKEKTLANTNTGWMGYLMCYFRYINSSTPIETLDDCKDVLIRVPTTQILSLIHI